MSSRKQSLPAKPFYLASLPSYDIGYTKQEIAKISWNDPDFEKKFHGSTTFLVVLEKDPRVFVGKNKLHY